MTLTVEWHWHCMNCGHFVPVGDGHCDKCGYSHAFTRTFSFKVER